MGKLTGRVTLWAKSCQGSKLAFWLIPFLVYLGTARVNPRRKRKLQTHRWKEQVHMHYQRKMTVDKVRGEGDALYVTWRRGWISLHKELEMWTARVRDCWTGSLLLWIVWIVYPPHLSVPTGKRKSGVPSLRSPEKCAVAFTSNVREAFILLPYITSQLQLPPPTLLVLPTPPLFPRSILPRLPFRQAFFLFPNIIFCWGGYFVQCTLITLASHSSQVHPCDPQTTQSLICFAHILIRAWSNSQCPVP